MGKTWCIVWERYFSDALFFLSWQPEMSCQNWQCKAEEIKWYWTSFLWITQCSSKPEKSYSKKLICGYSQPKKTNWYICFLILQIPKISRWIDFLFARIQLRTIFSMTWHTDTYIAPICWKSKKMQPNLFQRCNSVRLPRCLKIWQAYF